MVAYLRERSGHYGGNKGSKDNSDDLETHFRLINGLGEDE